MSEFEFAKEGLSGEEAARLGSSLRKASELVVRVPDAPDIDGGSYVRIPKIEKNRPAPPLEDYVAEMVLAARRVGENIMRRTLPENASSKERAEALQEIEDRVAAAEKYARWRYQGYKDAEIVSL